MKNTILTGLFAVFTGFIVSSAMAETYYIDPRAGSMTGDGSAGAPWSTLQDVVEAGLIESFSWPAPYSADSTLNPKNPGAQVTGGDSLVLLSGYHGMVDIWGYVNSETITIKAADGQIPTLSQLHFRSSSNWTVSGLTISPVFGDADESTILRIESHSWTGPSSHITIENNNLYSVADCSNWTVKDWQDNAKNGISVAGDDHLISHNRLTNINFGITVSGKRTTVSHNSVVNFAGDGMRGLGDYGLYEYNLVANAFKINDNHDDGFQSWARDGLPVIGVTLRGNLFYTNYNHPNPALLSTFQGIGCFDGFYEDWLIVNNLVAVSHYHGISLYGAENSKIINNTVVDDSRHADDKMVPWIRLTSHKDGSYGFNNIVRNNIGKLASISTGVTIDHNLDPEVAVGDHSNYDTYFQDCLNHNYLLKSGSPAVGAGTAEEAPEIDIRGRRRTGKIDVGAYQHGGSLPFLFLLL